MTTLTNAQVRFEAAVNGVRARGVHLAINVMQCCRSCIGFEDLGLPSAEARDEQPNAFTFAGQGNELTWQHGVPFYFEEQYEYDDEDESDFFGPRSRERNLDRPATTLYVYHGGPDLTAAQTVTEVFRGEGFEVDWDGTEHKAVIVHLMS
jgi:hypothetical protein